MKTRGFTLIELLGVIIILSLLMIIAFPKIINSVKSSSDKVDNITMKLISNAVELFMDNDKETYQKKSGDVYCITLSDLVNEGYLKSPITQSGSNVDLTTTKTVQIASTNSFSPVLVSNGSCTQHIWVPKCKRASSLHTATCTGPHCSSFGWTSISYGNLGTRGTLNSGDAFDCDVNGDGEYNSDNERFYYVSGYYNRQADPSTNIIDNTKAALIYYNNITYVAYNSSASSSVTPTPATAKTALPTWGNLELISTTRGITYADSSYITQFDYSGVSARLLTAQELLAGCGKTSSNWTTAGSLDSCKYLLENLQWFDLGSINYGYWLETPSDMTTAYVVNGAVSNRNITALDMTNSYYGIRPVIEIPLADMDY